MSKKAKAKGKEVSENGLSDYDTLVLATINTEAHTPRAIVQIIKHTLDQNTVVQTLNRLEKNNLVERVSSKAWKAKK